MSGIHDFTLFYKLLEFRSIEKRRTGIWTDSLVIWPRVHCGSYIPVRMGSGSGPNLAHFTEDLASKIRRSLPQGLRAILGETTPNGTEEKHTLRTGFPANAHLASDCFGFGRGAMAAQWEVRESSFFYLPTLRTTCQRRERWPGWTSDLVAPPDLLGEHVLRWENARNGSVFGERKRRAGSTKQILEATTPWVRWK